MSLETRVDVLESKMVEIAKKQDDIQSAVLLNTKITKDIADNTQELVDLWRGGKLTAQVVKWLIPIGLSAAGAWATIKGAFTK